MNPSSGKNRVCVVIPFFNERRFLKDLNERIPDSVDTIIFIDDGSTDGGCDLIELSNPKVILIKNQQNRGKGFSLRAGFLKCLELGGEYIISLDADLQHPPELIPGFIELLNEYDLVIGTRKFSKREMPLDRRISNFITSFIISKKAGARIYDSQSGYRAFNASALVKIMSDSDDFIAESEMLIKAGKNKLKIGHYPIPTIYGEEKSKINRIKVIRSFITMLFSARGR